MSTAATTPTTPPTPTPADAPANEPFRFYDNREKYLLFVTTTSEKAEVATRIGRELTQLKPTPPALRVFDAGTGNGVVLSHVLRDLHRRLPTVPFVVVVMIVRPESSRYSNGEFPTSNPAINSPLRSPPRIACGMSALSCRASSIVQTG